MKHPLAVVRFDDPDSPPETELATVERDGDRLTIGLDDGAALELDVWELLAAAHDQRPERAA